MSDAAQPGQPGTTPDAPLQGPVLRALSQYVKDLSFENPRNAVPEGQPNIDLGIDVSAMPHQAGNGIYEVILKLTARAEASGNALFVIELEYGGLFQVQGMSEADAEGALLVECPRLLFPFARRMIADITREGGFPPLLIDPVDFVQLYRQQKREETVRGHSEGDPSNG